MKSKTSPRKLRLSTETLRKLLPAELEQAYGGITRRICSADQCGETATNVCSGCSPCA
jgi:hypothetical protein